MKEALKTYGNMLIACVILLALLGIISALALFGRQGIIDVSGGLFEKMITVAGNSDTYNGMEFDNYKGIRAAGVVFNAGRKINARETNRVCDLFRADDGSNSKIEIIEIRNNDGEVISQGRIDFEDELEFEDPGIYDIYCRSRRVKGVEQITRITVPVNKGRSL